LLRADGANVARSVAEACQSGVVLTMVADDAALEALVFGEDAISGVAARRRAFMFR